MWDVIVIGSGISGLVCGAALARSGRRVLVLEQHVRPGGLTQTFERRDWRFATGVHYVSGAAPTEGASGLLRRLLDALCDEPIAWSETANPYDIVGLPGFSFGIRHPESAYRQDLLERFPEQRALVDAWFERMRDTRDAAQTMMLERGLPSWMTWALRLWKGAALERAIGTTLAEALAPVADPRLRAVLGARGGDYGALPAEAPLIEHALITGAYNDGAWYPVGGPGRFADSLGQSIVDRGGEIRTLTDVRRIVIESGRATGVHCVRDGVPEETYADTIVSTMGLHNTLRALGDEGPEAWRLQAAGLRAGISYVALYIGFEGDIAAAGATAANHWIYETENIDRRWRSPTTEDAPGLFVSFPSLKDPAHAGHHTAEVIALCEQGSFGRWLSTDGEHRDSEYRLAKTRIEKRLLAQFQRHFPALAPMVRFHEAATPLTQARFVRTPLGAMYGLEMSADRLESRATRIRTPVPGLLLAGQDVLGAGVQAAAISGLIAAASREPSLYALLR